jgi:hypothetical protein
MAEGANRNNATFWILSLNNAKEKLRMKRKDRDLRDLLVSLTTSLSAKILAEVAAPV